MNKRIDAVIPVYRPGQEFVLLLERLKTQTVPPDRIILMVTGEAEALPELPKGPEYVIRTLMPPDFDHAGTRNAGAALSDADYLLFMTQDAVPADERLVENLLKSFSDPDVGAAYARQLPRDGCRTIEKIRREANYPAKSRKKTASDVETLGLKAYFLSDVCALYERETFRALGGFQEPAVFNEDMVFAHTLLKSGRAVYYAADAQVIHSHEYTGKEERARAFDMAASQADHPEVFSSVSSEKEGAGLVKRTLRELSARKEKRRIPYFLYQCFMRYEGYLLGKHYKRLPQKLRIRLGSNKNYWRKNGNGTDQSHPL